MTFEEWKALAVKANAALLEKRALVLVTDEEKIAIRSCAEREYAFLVRPSG